MAKKILVVDDDPVIRVLIEEYLTSFGHQVIALEGGAACLKSLESEIPDLVVLDFQMPEMTGVDVLRQIRANPDTHSLPVIILSANSSTAEEVCGAELEASKFLEKPFDLKLMLEAVEDPNGKKV